MEIVLGLESYPPDSPPSVVALGAFDGIHLAHQKILATARTRARALGLRARAPAPITELAENLARIAEQGLDTAVVIVFTREFSLLEAEAFVKDVLVGRLKAREG